MQAVAAVYEHARHIRQHHRKARRAGKAGQPAQPLVAGGDIFALMRIGARHQKTGQPLGGQPLPQGSKARRAKIGAGGGGEGLEHRGLSEGFAQAHPVFDRLKPLKGGISANIIFGIALRQLALVIPFLKRHIIANHALRACGIDAGLMA